jgi:hypothetical protein
MPAPSVEVACVAEPAQRVGSQRAAGPGAVSPAERARREPGWRPSQASVRAGRGVGRPSRPSGGFPFLFLFLCLFLFAVCLDGATKKAH